MTTETTKDVGYVIDVALCVDKTGANIPVWIMLEQNAERMYEKLSEACHCNGRRIDSFRVRIFAFGDYAVDLRPMIISRYFKFPEEIKEFVEFCFNVEVFGGGDVPENALESLAHAIKSDWTDEGTVRRHVIMLFTDAPAVELGERPDFSIDDEPMDMPKDLSELGEWWKELDRESKRLLIFAPEDYPWPEIAATWDQVEWTSVYEGQAFQDFDFDKAIAALSKAVCQAGE